MINSGAFSKKSRNSAKIEIWKNHSRTQPLDPGPIKKIYESASESEVLRHFLIETASQDRVYANHSYAF